MSNNLRQIAKDLRSFVKRCKDVHYSDSLLISFLITGLLTIAPKLHADVASEQQEITAQTYDAITDLRQSFMRARKENEKSLKGAQSELAQLLKQGDQVIKSPWASFQFGTGFTNNDWGTTYRGRGGKFLEYFRRNNDLTKYVFDKDKHLYGATNLNIPRNQEPNALTINPANVHEPDTPPTPTSFNTIDVPRNPNFAYSYEAPTANWFNDGRRVKLDEWVDRRHTTTMPSYRQVGTNENYVYDDRFLNEKAQINDRANHTNYSHSTHTQTNANSASAVTVTGNSIIETSSGTIENLNHMQSGQSGVTFSLGGNINSISGDFHLGDGYYSYAYDGVAGQSLIPHTTTTADFYNKGSGDARSMYRNVNIDSSGNDLAGYSGTASLNKIASTGLDSHYSNSGNPSNQVRTTTDRNSSSVIHIDSTNVQVSNSSFSINTGQTNDGNNATTRAGILLDSTGSTIKTSTFHINAPTSTGISVTGNATSGTVGTGNTFNVNSSNSTGISVAASADISIGSSSGTENTFTVAAGNNGIFNAGTITVRKNVFDLTSGANATGIKNSGTLIFGGVGPADADKAEFKIGWGHNNGIENSGTGTVTFDNGSRTYFDITGGNSNGIYSSGGSITLAYSSSGVTFDVKGGSSNGIFASGGSVSIGSGTFNVTGSSSSNDENTGVLSTGGTVSSTSGTFNLDGNYHTGIRVHNAATSGNSISSTFKLKTGSHNVGLYIDNNSTASDSSAYDIQTGDSSGILVKSGSTLSSANSTITIGTTTTNQNISSNGIFMENGSTLSGNIDGTFNVYANNSNGVRFNNTITKTIGGTYTVSGNNSNGIYFGDTTAAGTGTPTIRGGSTFTVSGTGATGVYADNLTSLTVDGGSNTTYPTRFDVSGGVNSSGLLIQKVPTVTIKGVTEFTVEKSSIGIAIDNTDHDSGNRAINFEGEAGNIATSTPAKPVTFKVGTNANSTKNIGINIQNDGVYGNSIKIDGRTKTFDMKVGTVGVSGHNVGINNSAGVNNLSILQSKATMPPSTNTGSGEGVLEIVGNNNIGFANLGYIAQSADGIKFGSVEINGNRNIGMFFASNTSGNQLNATNNVGRIGWVKDTVIDLQGVIGGVSSTENSFGVYAVSGQSAEGNQGMTGAGPANVAVNDLQVSLNMGVGSASDKSILVYAGKGTGVKVTSDYATTNSNSTGSKTISDGTFLNASSAHTWGYATPESNSSTNTTIAYADGLFKDSDHKIAINAQGLEDHNSIVKLLDDVDMVSRRGVAFRAENGGKVYMGVEEYNKNVTNTATGAKHTRAAGYQSVIGYAAGSEEVTNPSANNGNLRKYSNVEINGDIVAADSNVLNRERYSGATGSQATKVSRTATYQNLGAYAAGGGSVNIKTANVSATAVEGKYSESHASATNASLIYGMAAYATGIDPKTTENPNGRGLVTTQNSSIDYGVTGSKGTGVVTGEDGALYAEYGGQIGFLGNIVNQNNIGRTVVTGKDYEFFGQKINAIALAMNKSDAATAATRNGKGDDLGVTNDHTNTTPFFVERTDLVDSNNNSVYKDNAAIAFKGTTNIDMYDGVLLTGNHYYYANNSGKPQVIDSTATNMLIDGTTRSVKKVIGDLNDSYSDYYTSLGTSNTEETKAKYRGMENVHVAVLGNIDLGLINGSDALKWNQNQNRTTTDGYLKTIANYAGMNEIKNDFTSNTYALTGTKGNTKTRKGGGFAFTTSVINSKLEVDNDVDLEDNFNTKSTAADRDNDPFNDIKMESTVVTINSGKKVTGDIAAGYRAGQGLSMANSLYRWSELNNASATYRRSKTEESGYKNFGEIDVWGGTNKNGNITNITAVNVANGIAQNGDGTSTNEGTIKVDHGNAIVGTDGSKLSNTKGSKITVTGIYTAGGTISALRTSNGFDASSETAVGPTGNNYGIVGISTKNVRDAYNPNNSKGRYGSNAVEISNTDGKITVDGDFATGIYAQNTTYSGDSDPGYNGLAAKQEDVSITYSNLQSTSDPTLIKVNTSNKIKDNKSARSVGIALDHDNSGTVDNAARRGGKIFLNTQGNDITASNNKADILTSHNGIGVYAESTEIKFGGNSDVKGLNVETKNRGIGVFVTDDSSIGETTDRVGKSSTKKLYYNYNGDNDSQGYAVAFGSTLNREGTNNTWATTDATNYLDIEFANSGKTKEGIAGVLVNTDNTDRAINYGNIKEHSTTVTNEKEYGAVVNRGTFVNYGEIKLNDSLNKNAKDVTADDLKKVNVGILANDHTKDARYNTFIENYNDITVGDVTTAGNKNVGNFAIYGYNVKTGGKSDGSNSIIKISRNNYGIYSGDGNVDIQGTKLFVGNDTVLGHEKTMTGLASTTNPGAYPINRQTAYTQANDLLPGRKTDAAIGVYIGSNENLSNKDRSVNVSADMDIDRFSYGIVLAENNFGTATTRVTIGSSTNKPTINLASNKVAGGQVKSHYPSDPKVPEEVKEQGNAVYYYSADKNSRGTTWANVTMNGDYNTAYYTKGSMDNYGTIDLRSAYDVANEKVNPNDYIKDGKAINRGYGNVGILSANPDAPSTNYGKITTGMSDTLNMMYSAGMAAGRNAYKGDGNFDHVEDMGYIVNNGEITVKENQGIGMFATGNRSKAINNGTIKLIGENSIGMYLDHGAIGENHGLIEGNAKNLSGVVAINGGYIKNYGTINIEGTGSYGIVTDGSKFTIDANGNPVLSTDSGAKSTVQNNGGNGGTDLYGGTETSVDEGSSGNPKTTGVGTTITMPDAKPITEISVDGVNTPIFTVDTDSTVSGQWAKNITITSSIQTGGTRIIDLNAKNEWGNPVWEHASKDQLSEVTSIGMYIDTSGVRYTNPINGLNNLPKLGKVNLYFGPEATLYTNAKAIRLGSNMLKPFNDALSNLPGGAKVNPLSASLTWQVAAKLDSNNQLSEVYMSKVPYHSFAYDNDTSLVNFTNNLDNIYEIAKQESAEKIIFNKLNSLGNGEGHILAQAFDQMRGHIYGGVQQRIKATSDVLGGEINGLRNERNVSKDSNKFKAFGQRNEFKTDTAGMPDWYSNAGGVAFVHEDETVRLGQSSGWYAGVVNNYYTFKDLSKSYENQAMAKVGVFKSIPLDGDGTFVLNVGGDGFFGRNDMKRRFWVVDQEFRAKASYYSYGAGLNAGLEKAFVINDGFSIVPNVGIRAEYGRFSSIHENGDMALNVKSDDYVSVKPSAGIDFRYSQEVFKNSNLTASLGFAYENEIGKLYDVENEARIVGAWTDYFGIRGDKEDKRGNFKSDLKLGLDNGRFGFNVNTGYDSKGHNFRAGLGLKVLY